MQVRLFYLFSLKSTSRIRMNIFIHLSKSMNVKLFFFFLFGKALFNWTDRISHFDAVVVFCHLIYNSSQNMTLHLLCVEKKAANKYVTTFFHIF